MKRSALLLLCCLAMTAATARRIESVDKSHPCYLLSPGDCAIFELPT